MMMMFQISAAFIISSSLGAKVFPVLVGQLVETWPMALHYLSLSIVTVCAAIFAAANIIVRRSRTQRWCRLRCIVLLWSILIKVQTQWVGTFIYGKHGTFCILKYRSHKTAFYTENENHHFQFIKVFWIYIRGCPHITSAAITRQGHSECLQTLT